MVAYDLKFWICGVFDHDLKLDMRSCFLPIVPPVEFRRGVIVNFGLDTHNFQRSSYNAGNYIIVLFLT